MYAVWTLYKKTQNGYSSYCNRQRFNAFSHHRVAISIAEDLDQTLYIYFQEPEGKFGKIVQKKKAE
jgi:hypothetical protein